MPTDFWRDTTYTAKIIVGLPLAASSTISMTFTCSDCAAPPTPAWTDLTVMKAATAYTDLHSVAAIAESDTTLTSVLTNPTFLEPDTTLFVYADDIGISTIGDCSFSGSSLTNRDINLVGKGIVEPYLALTGGTHWVMRCGVLFTIAADTTPGLTMSLTLAANGVDYDLSIPVRKVLSTVTDLTDFTCFKSTLNQMLTIADKTKYDHALVDAETKMQQLNA